MVDRPLVPLGSSCMAMCAICSRAAVRIPLLFSTAQSSHDVLKFLLQVPSICVNQIWARSQPWGWLSASIMSRGKGVGGWGLRVGGVVGLLLAHPDIDANPRATHQRYIRP